MMQWSKSYRLFTPTGSCFPIVLLLESPSWYILKAIIQSADTSPLHYTVYANITAPFRTDTVPGQDDDDESMVKQPNPRELLWKFRDPKGLWKWLVINQCFSLSFPEVIANDYSQCQKPGIYALPEVIFKLKVEVEHGQCFTILSSVIEFLVCFVSFHYVCR